MDDSARLNQAAYDQMAERFAERNAAMPQQLIDSAGRLLARLSESGLPSPRVLDLGCGTGRDMAWFEAHGALVVGADLSTGMLAQARKQVRGALLQQDMRYLSFAPGSFQAVWCQAALLHLPKAQAPQALAEIRRVLAQHGLFYVSVQRGDSEGIESRTYEPAERYYAHYRLDELAGLLERAGFTIQIRGEREDRRSWIWLEAARQ